MRSWLRPPRHRRPREGGFLLPLAAAGGLVLLLSSLSLQAAALQQRLRLAAEWQARARSDRLDGGARQLAVQLAGSLRSAAPGATPVDQAALTQALTAAAAPLSLQQLELTTSPSQPQVLVARLALAEPAGGSPRRYQLWLEPAAGRVLGVEGTGR